MSHRILVVDDNPANLRLACDVLELAGFAVEKAADAEAAQALLERVTPDLILMDIGLPGMDGLTFTRKLRADERFARVPVVALTAFAMKGDDGKAREAGCDGYITKPFDTRRLPEQVLGFLHGGAGGGARSAPMNVLIVEDHPADLKLMNAVLQMEGHVVCESVSAEGAAAAIAAAPPDVIMLDLRLPGMDGVALIRQLKANPETRGIPIVAMTAYPEDYRREDLVAAGCDAYVVKPIDTRTLPRKLEELAGRHSGE